MILAKAQAEVDVSEEKDATIRSFADSLASGVLPNGAVIEFFAMPFPARGEKQ
jgi:hypothetical protein